jgi:3-oxoacyl-[acyl-carrier protein] reductase
MPKEAAVVFGATGAIGQEIVASLRKRGLTKILATYFTQTPELVTDATSDIKWMFFDANSDVSSENLSIKTLSETTIENLFVFYCIGLPSTKQLVSETAPKELISLFNTNCVGLVRAFQLVKTDLRRTKGCLVILSSDTTRVIGSKNGAYSASKAALEVLAETLAKEESIYGVRVIVLSPSLVESPLADHILSLKGVEDKDSYVRDTCPWNRLITIAEVAEASVALGLDPAWQYMSGQVVRLSANI